MSQGIQSGQQSKTVSGIVPIMGAIAHGESVKRTKTTVATTLGVDIGGTSVKAAVCVDGECIRTGQSLFYVKPTVEQLRAAIQAAAGPIRELRAVGLCVPGVMDRVRPMISLEVNVPGL